MPFHIDHRPDSFDEFYGNISTVKSLQSLLKKKDKMPHSIIFQGPSGCGKTTLARIMAKELDCDIKSNSFTEINAATDTGIDTVRNITKTLWMKPMFGDVKIYLIDEVHSVSKAFQNGILKPLEDTPPFVYFFLCTTDPQKLLKTIRNRCTTYEVDLLSDKDMGSLLEDIIAKEDKPIDKINEVVIDDIIEVADGCPRQALVILDQVIDMEPARQRRAVKDYITNEAKTIELCRALLKGANWPNIQPILKDLTDDPEKVRKAVIGYMSVVALNQKNPQTVYNAGMIYKHFSKAFYDTGKAGLTFACWAAVENQDLNI